MFVSKTMRTAALLALALAAKAAVAFDVPSYTQTHWVGVQFGTAHSRQMLNISRQGYELSNGQPVTFDRWYRSQWQDLQLTFMTQLSPQWGVLWGIGTGERAPKYQIDPSVQLGLLFQQPMGAHSTWSVRATTRLGGRLREKTCSASYGIEGYETPQTVNCRLAASVLKPEDTLNHLINEAPRDRFLLNIRYEHRF
jgi:hypothetical protein